MKKKTHEEFVNQMANINPNIAFLDEYNGDRNKIKCKCMLCGNEWMAAPGHLVQGKGCPACGIKRQAKAKSKTHDQFVSELAILNTNILVLGHYEGTRNRIEVQCKKCGHIWTPVPSSLLNGTGCPKCAGNVKRTHDDFVKSLKAKSPTIEVLGEYINTDTKIKVRCEKCGKIWFSTPNNLLDGHGCGRCAGRKNHEEFVRELEAINPDVEVKGHYRNVETKIEVRCKVCGYEWKSKPSQLLKGHGCHKCGIKKQSDTRRKPQEQFEAELAEINTNIEVIGNYHNNMTPIEVRCKKCDYVWQGIPGNLLKGQGCPRCAGYLHTSFPEQAIYFYVKKAFPDAINSYKQLFDQGMEIDIYIPSKKIGIEYDGKAWHKGEKAYSREIKKYSICHENNIRLVRIKELQQISDALTADSIIYTEEALDSTLKKVAEMLGVEFDINLERDKNAIFDQYKSFDANDEFVTKLKDTNPDIIPLTKYTLSSSKIKCKCRICGYEWMVTPNKLLMGRGCPACSGKMKKTTEQFKDDLRKVTTEIEVIGEYTNALSPVMVRCKKCNHEWSPTAASLLAGNGCPNCAHRVTISHEQFLDDLKQLNSNIEVLGVYKTKRTPILVKCKKCGREWMATPDNLLRNHGCAKCAGNIKMTTEVFAERIAKINDKFKVIGTYKNAKTKIKVVCQKCGYERESTPDCLLRGLRCPNCDKE